MANVVKSQVRLVRCPRCQKVLEEPTESIVYKCGGCDTVLQAKKRKNNNTSTEPETHPRDSKEKGISSLHQKDSSISSVDTFQSESCKSQYEIGECSKVRSGQTKFLDELQCSRRLSSSFHEIDSNSSIAREPIEQHEDECPVDGYENELRAVDMNFSDENSELNELKHHGTEGSSAPREAGEQMEDDECIRRCEYESEGCEMESPEYTNSLAGSSPFTRSSHDDSEVNAGTGISHSLSQESNISDPNDFAGHTLEYIEHAKSSGEIEKPSPVQTEVDQSPLHEGILSDTFVSVQHQQPEQSDKEIAPSFDRIASVDTLDNLPPVTHRDMPKSPATRSYYAYDGSASSCDGDSQVPSKECKEDSMLSRKPRTHHPAKNCSQVLPRRMHRAGEGRSQNQDKWAAESRRRDQTFGHRRQLMTDECVVSTGSHGSPSALWQNDFRHHSSFYPSNMPTYADREKMELLRMVHDLENQLQETRLSKGKANRRLYSDQFRPDADATHRRCPIICSQGQRFLPKTSRIPFSGEPVHYRHRGDCLCLHCSPQVWHCSSQLPLGSICCNKSHLAACTNHTIHSSSSSQSPQHYTSSKYSRWCHEPKSSSDQRQKDHELRKLQLGERYGKMRHVLPFEGGAPIVACDHCSELLQLPADFGVLKRRSYQLVRCNACLKVLKFDLRNRTHISDDLLSENIDSVYDITEQAATLAPPPSEVGESSDLNERNLLTTPQRCPHAESLSYSDDLGPSFCRSCSTEVEPSSVPHRRTTFNRKVSSASSIEPMEDRKMKSVMRESRWDRAESAAGPSNWGISSSEIEEVHEHPNAGSPLHRLMGYSTISQVLK